MQRGAAAMSVRNAHRSGSSLSHDRLPALARGIRAMHAVVRRGEPRREITVITAFGTVPFGDPAKHFPAPTSTNLHQPRPPSTTSYFQSHRSELNRRPLDYESRALPL